MAAWDFVAALVTGAAAGVATGALFFALFGRRVLREVAKLRRDEQATRASVDQLANAVAGSQAWFWTPEWQEGEREADEDLAAGRSVVVTSLDDMDQALHEAARRYGPQSQLLIPVAHLRAA